MSSLAPRTKGPLTAARIDLGRAGSALPTAAMLDFAADHASARDAVWHPLDVTALTTQIDGLGMPHVLVHSRARSRAEYLRRPDLGRLLAPECMAQLRPDEPAPAKRLTVVVADGLSAAATAHAPALIAKLRDELQNWQLDTIVIATEARVALGDPVGELRGAEAVIVLIGERPGLRSTDSLGAYLTYAPRTGRSDAERNCVSNIRPGGLSIEQAAHTLLYLLRGARSLGHSGVLLKDHSTEPAASALATGTAGRTNADSLLAD